MNRHNFSSLLFAGILILTFWANGCSSQTTEDHTPPVTDSVPDAPEPPVDTLTEIRVSMVGDLMCHSTQFNYARIAKDSFDFKPCFEEVKSVLASADLCVGNLETVFAGPTVKYEGYPAFNTPDDFLDAMKDTGFDFLVTSNNHSLDQGEKGVMRTLDKLDELGFDHTGTYRDQQDRDSIRVTEVEGIRIAWVNYTYGMNGFSEPAGKDWMVNEIDTALIRQDIKAAEALNPDVVAVFFHWGLENKREPVAEQKRIMKHSVACGADLVIGSHPHVIQPIEFYKTNSPRLDTGVVIWSMGNFLSNQYWRYTDAGIIVNLHLKKNLNSGKVSIGEVSYVPTWVFRGKHEKKKIHVILPTERSTQDSAYFYLNEEMTKKFKEAHEDTRTNIVKYDPRIKLYSILKEEAAD